MAAAHIAIIGAGPAGSLAAILLRQAGHDVHVLERGHFPRFVIGESLLPSCMGPLASAGLIPRLEAQRYQVKGGVSILRGDKRCDFDFSRQFHDGWTYTYQVKRAEFDQVLVDAAHDAGARIDFGASVDGFDGGDAPRLQWTSEDGARHQASFDFVLDASGYGRVLARLLELDAPSGQALRRSVFAHVRGDLRQDGEQNGWSWASCLDTAWLWLIPFADGTTSVGVVAEPEYFDGLPEDPGDMLKLLIAREPNLHRRIPDPALVFVPRTLEGYSAKVKTTYGPGFALIGNAGDFIDPIFSSGIALALNSAQRAVSLLCRQLEGEAVSWQDDFAEPMRAGTDVFRDYVSWWYEGSLEKLFFAESSDAIKRQMCSVLCGYVWDADNLYVSQRARKIPQLLRMLASKTDV